MLPCDRDSFKDYCLRKLGQGVITINVSPDQVDDRVDEALNLFWQYHFDGAEKIYYKHQITADDKTNQYITMPDNVIGAVDIFPLGAGITGGGMFSIQYQIALNDLYTFTSQSMVPYTMAMYQLQSMEQLLIGQKPLRYNKYNNKLYIDMSWADVAVNDYLIVVAYEVVDPELYQKAWADVWLLQYATALIKEQWGSNMTKFTAVQMPGGIMFSGDRILSDAQLEIAKLKEQIMNQNRFIGFMMG